MISRNLLSALPDAGLAGLFLLTWIAPTLLDEKMVSDLMIVMIMEFIIIHSSVFMGIIIISSFPMARKIRYLLGLGLLYSLFVAGFSFGFGVWWPFIGFWGLMANRLSGIILGRVPTEEQKALVGKTWILGVVCYLGGVTITSIVPLPPLGVTYEVIAAQGIEGSGAWNDEPHNVLAFGTLYFSATAWSEYKNHAWLRIPGELFAMINIGSRPAFRNRTEKDEKVQEKSRGA